MAGVGIRKMMTHTVRIRYMQASLGTRIRLYGSKVKNNNQTTKHKPRPAALDHDQGTLELKEDQRISCWVPHYRTGIYYPRGHEAILEDISEGAASSCLGDTTFWMRNTDGVDKPDP
ncbi:OLC1v1002953C1 [Oldenlandia corymbosa var. corymbosa]|uniref:OLC1v1002953C1 n=1 Tax=Oldenlandia corymbosa var. corymbosa TaxID=529605 RepID=A0AAV1DBA7_OLDCO|nr:OLC1v1002953C1 [Oldenlandia corymbosa var. corymbosa]